MTDLFWSFAPWLVFLLASRVTSLYGAVAAGALAAVVVLMRAVGRRKVHMLDVASTVYFAALGATLVVIRPGHLDFWAHYAQAGSHAALMILVFGSILVGRPFTEAYAKDTVPDRLGTPIDSARSTDGSRPSGGLPFSSERSLSFRRGQLTPGRSSCESSFPSGRSTTPTCSRRGRPRESKGVA